MKRSDETEHAQKRRQQRGISQIQIDLIRTFGDDHYQKGGSSLSYISAKKIAMLRHALDKIEKVALVKECSEKVVTVLHMNKRINTTQYAA